MTLSSIFDLSGLSESLISPAIRTWIQAVETDIEQNFSVSRHGDLQTWLDVVSKLPNIADRRPILNQDRIQATAGQPPSAGDSSEIRERLLRLHPWRKGPYQIFDIHIDSEWRSDFKWARLRNKIKPLHGKTVLDVGCGNGYHCWRMAGDGARTVIGIEPGTLSVVQFHAVKRMLGDLPVFVLPLRIEDVAGKVSGFDTVFSMGVLYHRRSPIDHLLELQRVLAPGGELVLETLVIDGPPGQSLVPAGRYAKMRNVWFLPSCRTLEGWLERCGFNNIRLIDVSPTTANEQRSTPWMRFHSLSDFLHPEDSSLTCEGLPAPKRAIFAADAPR